MLEKIKNEPVVVTALVGALLALGVEFGLPLTQGQETAIQAVVVAVLALFARSQVTPSSKVHTTNEQFHG
jgi:hypothetical protein